LATALTLPFPYRFKPVTSWIWHLNLY
jgi:hypothetical protein